MLVAVAVLAVCAIGMSGLALSLKAPLVVLAAALLVRGLRVLREPWPLLEWDAAGQWWLHGTADPEPLELLRVASLGPLLILRMRTRERARTLLITPDRVAAEDLRRLRARLALG